MFPEPPSRAEALFKQITESNDPVALLKSWLNSSPPTEETDFLDFISADRLTPDSTDDNWSKALSGFANTEGGVIVWGIKTEKNSGGIDSAKTTALAPDVAALRGRLKDRVSFLSSPLIQIPDENIRAYTVEGSAGFVVCYVPRSRFKPHRAEHNQRFYIRVTDDFKQPSVEWLRGMFSPSIQPDLVPFVEVRPSADSVLLHIKIRNDGSGTANDVFFTVDGQYLLTWYPDLWMSGVGNGPGTSYVCRRPMHPGEVFPLVSYRRTVDLHRALVSLQLFAQNWEPIFATIDLEPEQQRRNSLVSMSVSRLRK